MSHDKNAADELLRKGRATMDDEQAMRLVDLRQRIDTGDYRVEPEAVADAIIRRGACGPRARSAQVRSERVLVSGHGVRRVDEHDSGEPATTRPTQRQAGRPVASISLASAGRQTHSS